MSSAHLSRRERIEQASAYRPFDPAEEVEKWRGIVRQSDRDLARWGDLGPIRELNVLLHGAVDVLEDHLAAGDPLFVGQSA